MTSLSIGINELFPYAPEGRDLFLFHSLFSPISRTVTGTQSVLNDCILLYLLITFQIKEENPLDDWSKVDKSQNYNEVPI